MVDDEPLSERPESEVSEYSGVKRSDSAPPRVGVFTGPLPPSAQDGIPTQTVNSPPLRLDPSLGQTLASTRHPVLARSMRQSGMLRDVEETEPPEWLRPGERVHQYELIRELGQGGMGIVWSARDTRLGRRVAIKFLGVPSSAHMERFSSEARATAKCNHENIVVIHEVNEFEGTPMMVLEFLRGAPLTAQITPDTVAPQKAIELGIPIVRALGRAHSLGIVHRDLKPDNIFVTDDGVVKVLDFGIAKLYSHEGDSSSPASPVFPLEPVEGQLGSTTGLVGTLPYMSPEQWGLGKVDQRSDFWSVGIILFELVTGRHPLEPFSAQDLAKMAAAIDEALPSPQRFRNDLPDGLVRLIERCLAKPKEERYQSAEELLDDLLALSPHHQRGRLRDGDNPYLGLAAFQEADAHRFFGRSRETARALMALEEQPLMVVLGPSGVGKSSFVRAGILPALKARGEDWESIILRPGRSPFDSLASALLPLLDSQSSNTNAYVAQHEKLARRLQEEPGYLGTVLRGRARTRGARYLLFVDQFEELYTLVSDPLVRQAFTSALSGVADDASTPLRVVLSMRSDLLDRVSEDPRFLGDVTRGIQILSAPDEEGLREALTAPLGMAGYQFEKERTVEEMVIALKETQGALPLLQFAASKLWEQRDNSRKLLPHDAYTKMGGIGGSLAKNADEVVQGMSPELRALTRAIFLRLVTPERTRAIVEQEELFGLHDDQTELERLIQHLASARLIVIQTSGAATGGATIEIVHESLLSAWPRLRRWLDASQEDAAFLAQLRGASRQWDQRSRDRGLLWRGEALEEAVRFKKSYTGPLSELERDYLEASVDFANRAQRIKRTAITGAFLFLTGLVFVGSIALVKIRSAEREAVNNAQLAEKEAKRARAGEATIEKQLTQLQEKETARLKAEKEALSAIQAADLTREELEEAYAKIKTQLLALQTSGSRIQAAQAQASAAQQEAAAAEKKREEAEGVAKLSRDGLEQAYAKMQVALREARSAKANAQEASARAQASESEAKAAKAQTEALLQKERAKNAELRSKIITDLR